MVAEYTGLGDWMEFGSISIDDHIVHYDKIRRFNAVNLKRGYKPLVIYSPREVARYDEDDH